MNKHKHRKVGWIISEALMTMVVDAPIIIKNKKKIVKIYYKHIAFMLIVKRNQVILK